MDALAFFARWLVLKAILHPDVRRTIEAEGGTVVRTRIIGLVLKWA